MSKLSREFFKLCEMLRIPFQKSSSTRICLSPTIYNMKVKIKNINALVQKLKQQSASR